MKVLDFGSGISPEFISDIDSTGAEYYAYDISKTVQTELANIGVNVVTIEDLTNKEIQFDIIYLSSVFHEIISYLNRQERTETITMIIKSLKPGGHLIIRDWANPNNTDLLFCIETVSKQAEKEMDIWINELLKNSIIDDDFSKYEDGSIVTHTKNAYEIIFHTVWGLKSLSRESKEQYNIKDSIMNWIYYPWKKSLKLKTDYQEKDETYLNWDEIREMYESGLIDFQLHTHSHQLTVKDIEVLAFYDNESSPYFKRESYSLFFDGNYDEKKDAKKLNGLPVFKLRSKISIPGYKPKKNFVEKYRSIVELQENKSEKEKKKFLNRLFKEKKDEFFDKISEEQFKETVKFEILENKKIISEKLGKVPDCLAYPWGHRYKGNREDIKKLGVDVFITTRKGVNSLKLNKNWIYRVSGDDFENFDEFKKELKNGSTAIYRKIFKKR